MQARTSAAFMIAAIVLSGCVKSKQLHDAASFGDYEKASKLIDSGALIWYRDWGGETALHKSTYEGFEDITELLLEKGQNPNARTFNEKFAPMHYAAINGNPAIVESLIEGGARIDIKDKKKRTPLYLAAGEGNDLVVDLLLTKNADPNALSKGKYGPLHAAAYVGDVDSAALLISAGASVDLIDKRGNTPLLWAAGNDQEEMVEYLINQGAVIDVVNKDGSTALEWALRNENASLAAFLGSKGANYDAAVLSIRLRMPQDQILAMIGDNAG